MGKVNKFRMWDKRLKKMAFTGYHVVGDVTAFGGMEHWIEETRNLTPECKSSMERWNDFIEMQWTGLKDKNGVDIYEEDLVTGMSMFHGRGFVRKQFIYHVQWADHVCGYILKHVASEDKMYSILDINDEKAELEVIGHIYEEKL